MSLEPNVQENKDKTVRDKSLKDRAINLKGKAYVQVADRVLYFNEVYKNGSIVSELLTPPEKAGMKGEVIVVRGIVTPDVSNPARQFIDYSQAVVGTGMVNVTAALENACTSAIGRALAMMGIGVIDGIASVDEINKATSPAVAAASPKPMPSPYVLKKGPVGGAWVAPPKPAPKPPVSPPNTADGQPF